MNAERSSFVWLFLLFIMDSVLASNDIGTCTNKIVRLHYGVCILHGMYTNSIYLL